MKIIRKLVWSSPFHVTSGNSYLSLGGKLNYGFAKVQFGISVSHRDRSAVHE